MNKEREEEILSIPSLFNGKSAGSVYEHLKNKNLIDAKSNVKINNKNKARRYNSDKIRHELIPSEFLEALAKVYTIGAEKYTLRGEDGNIIDDGADNWRKGLDWRSIRGSIQRHLNKFDKGEDFDEEYPQELLDKYGPTLHLANAAWGLATLITYYKIHPELDDRIHIFSKEKKVSLDLDDCIVDWCKAWSDKFNHPLPKDWNFSYNMENNLKSLSKQELEDFYLSLPVKTKAENIPFPIHCYITSRSVDIEITKKWIENNGFPTMPVYSVGFGESKVEAFKQSGADYHIDDGYHNYIEMTKVGIPCFLLSAPHNEKFNVGYKRIKDFQDFKNRFL